MPARLAVFLILKGETNEVLDEFVVTDDMPDDVKASVLAVRADAWRALRETDRAREALEEAAALAPSNPFVHVGLARLAMQENELDAAEPNVAKAVSLAPEEADVIALQADFAFAKKDYVAAEAAYAHLAEVQSGNPFPAVAVGADDAHQQQDRRSGR